RAFQKLPCARWVVVLVGRKNNQKEPVTRRAIELRNIEYGMIRHRQPVQRQHAEHRRQSREENRHLKGHDDERWPGIKRTAANVDWIADVINPPLQSECASAAQQATDQAN